MSDTANAVRNPFPGLRPFRVDEEHLFFGRERQVDAMVDKLAATHFLAVVGTSGSGKSSLVNCGLMPALRRGLLAKAGTRWRIAKFRPGDGPVKKLVEALACPGVLFDEDDPRAARMNLRLFIETTLRMSKQGLLDLFKQAHLDAGTNLLIVVDQFEELFRFGVKQSEAIALVNLLLEVGAQSAAAIYVVLTMRTDHLGDCTKFPGLAEAANAGQYLVPRLTRRQRRDVIQGPIAVADAEIAPVLLTRLVNDVGDDPDQLSILQHALNRTWARWEAEGGTGPLGLEHYRYIGEMSEALDRHADRAFDELDGRQQEICRRLFRALTDLSDGRGVRKPTDFDVLCALTTTGADELTAVIDVFRKPSRSFLMPPDGEPLAGAKVDISHESLMRLWTKLVNWAREEADAARQYRRLAETAGRFFEIPPKAAELQDPELQLALDWRAHWQPNRTWARRYAKDPLDADAAAAEFDRAEEFLDLSDAKARAEVAARRRRRYWIFGGILVAISAVFGAFAATWREAKQRVETNSDLIRQAREWSGRDSRRSGWLLAAVKSPIPQDASDEFAKVLERGLAVVHDAHHAPVRALALSADGVVASGDDEGAVRLWRTANGTEIASLGSTGSPVLSLAFAADGGFVYAGFADGRLLACEMADKATFSALMSSPDASGASAVTALAAGGSRLAVARADGHVSIWTWNGSQHEREDLDFFGGQAALCVALSSRGSQVASGAADGQVKVWDLARGEFLRQRPDKGDEGSGGKGSDWPPHDLAVVAVAFSPDDSSLLTASWDHHARVWDLENGAYESLPSEKALLTASWSPQGDAIVTAGEDDYAQLWRRDADNRWTCGTRLTGHGGPVVAAVFRTVTTADGRPSFEVVTASEDGRARRFCCVEHNAVAEAIWSVAEHRGALLGVRSSHDGSRFLTHGADGTVRVWSPPATTPTGFDAQKAAFAAGMANAGMDELDPVHAAQQLTELKAREQVATPQVAAAQGLLRIRRSAFEQLIADVDVARNSIEAELATVLGPLEQAGRQFEAGLLRETMAPLLRIGAEARQHIGRLALRFRGVFDGSHEPAEDAETLRTELLEKSKQLTDERDQRGDLVEVLRAQLQAPNDALPDPLRDKLDDLLGVDGRAARLQSPLLRSVGEQIKARNDIPWAWLQLAKGETPGKDYPKTIRDTLRPSDRDDPAARPAATRSAEVDVVEATVSKLEDALSDVHAKHEAMGRLELELPLAEEGAAKFDRYLQMLGKFVWLPPDLTERIEENAEFECHAQLIDGLARLIPRLAKTNPLENANRSYYQRDEPIETTSLRAWWSHNVDQLAAAWTTRAETSIELCERRIDEKAAAIRSLTMHADRFEAQEWVRRRVEGYAAKRDKLLKALRDSRSQWPGDAWSRLEQLLTHRLPALDAVEPPYFPTTWPASARESWPKQFGTAAQRDLLRRGADGYWHLTGHAVPMVLVAPAGMNPFLIDAHEITVEEFIAGRVFEQAGPAKDYWDRFGRLAFAGSADSALLYGASAEVAEAYCRHALPGGKLRLPTSTEWLAALAMTAPATPDLQSIDPTEPPVAGWPLWDASARGIQGLRSGLREWVKGPTGATGLIGLSLFRPWSDRPETGRARFEIDADYFGAARHLEFSPRSETREEDAYGFRCVYELEPYEYVEGRR
ncbi:MAG: hypothetical protein KDC98_09055 [Planctomycetes bacterium]|nr:hypothetical protein [Planctomycetota bacterium]